MDSKQVAKAIILDGEYHFLILATDNNPQFEGHWDLPGGHVMINENVVDGLIREVWEETGLIIRNPEELYAKGTTTFFAVDLPAGEIRLSTEHKDHKFISIDQLDDYRISDKFKEAIRRAHE